MKTFVISGLSIVLVSILFCPMVMPAPTMPADLQIVQPDPSLPKELSAFWGKWEEIRMMQYFLIVEKIDEEKASLYLWRGGNVTQAMSPWERCEAQVIKDRGKYKLWFRTRFSSIELTLKGEDLYWSSSGRVAGHLDTAKELDSDMRLRRVH